MTAGTVLGQQASAPIVQPGTPGENSRILSSVKPGLPREPLKPDVDFMQGMIMHHGQAVEMVELLKTRGRSKDLQALGKRISISQTDEMQFMRQWLEERGKPGGGPGREGIQPGHPGWRLAGPSHPVPL